MGPYVLEIMANSSFHKAGSYIAFLALIPLFNGLYNSLGSGISLGEKQYLMPAISALGCGATIGASFLLIPHFGVPGAGMSTAIGWAIMAILGLFYGQSNFRINFDLKRIFLLVSICLVSLLVFQFTSFLLFQKLLISLGFLLLTILILPKNDLTSVKSLILSKIQKT